MNRNKTMLHMTIEQCLEQATQDAAAYREAVDIYNAKKRIMVAAREKAEKSQKRIKAMLAEQMRGIKPEKY